MTLGIDPLDLARAGHNVLVVTGEPGALLAVLAAEATDATKVVKLNGGQRIHFDSGGQVIFRSPRRPGWARGLCAVAAYVDGYEHLLDEEFMT